MKTIIGFASQYYTLWNHHTEPQYRTDSYGNHHQVGVYHYFNYVKNISKSLDRVQELHPGIAIDEELRGQTRSFSKYREIALPEGFFWVGKYSGKSIDEIMESDFSYCCWALENLNNSTADYIRNHVKYQEYLQAQEQEKSQLIAQANCLQVGDIVHLQFQSNGYNADDNYTECWANAEVDDLRLAVKCPGAKLVTGMFTYVMPVINGKAQRTRNKRIRVKVVEIIKTEVFRGSVKQLIAVA